MYKFNLKILIQYSWINFSIRIIKSRFFSIKIIKNQFLGIRKIEGAFFFKNAFFSGLFFGFVFCF